MSVEMWLLIGTIGMAVGSILLFFPMQSNKTEGDEGDSIIHFLVPLIAMTLYLLMYLGGGVVHRPSGRDFYYGRYIDWTITTPLLLFSLISSIFRGMEKQRPGLRAGLLGTDVYMILTGYVAAYTDNLTMKWTFYALSCGAFLAIYALLWGPFRKLSYDSPEGEIFRKKMPVLSLVWFFYPIVFLGGQEGMRLWSAGVDATWYTALDLIAKVGYGLWAISLAKATAPRKADLPASGARLAGSR